MAEAKKMTWDEINKLALDLRGIRGKDLNKMIREKGINLDLVKTSDDDKILALIHVINKLSGPIPSINSIVNHRYKGVGSTKLLESYPTFVIDRILKKRRIKFTEDMPILEKTHKY